MSWRCSLCSAFGLGKLQGFIYIFPHLSLGSPSPPCLTAFPIHLCFFSSSQQSSCCHSFSLQVSILLLLAIFSRNMLLLFPLPLTRSVLGPRHLNFTCREIPLAFPLISFLNQGTLDSLSSSCFSGSNPGYSHWQCSQHRCLRPLQAEIKLLRFCKTKTSH